MTLEKFRIMHSELIEHYQFIEMHLEGIYALLCGKSFVDGLSDVETRNIAYLTNEIKRMELEMGVSIISGDEHEKIESARLRRNYWCHDCYTKPFNLKNTAFIKLLVDDVRKAEELREELYQIKIKRMQHHFF